MSYLILVLLFTTSAFATLEKIQIKNLDLTYANPYGTGELEKLDLGLELFPKSMPITISRKESSMEIVSPFVTFEYLNPSPFVHNIQNLDATKLNLKLDYKDSSASAATLHFTAEKTGPFVFDQLELSCQGNSLHKDPIDRLKEDCLQKMSAKSAHMELPFDFIKSIAKELPDEDTEIEAEMPANDFSLSMTQGDFYSYVRIKFIVRAYLKIWGFVQHENDGKTLAIRVDSIKYGVLPVTTLVMNILRTQIQSENISVDPPWIRIKLGNK